VLVAYEGARPVYATLVSTGKRTRETPEETARIASKMQAADMNSDLVDVYSVAQVPWTMYYDRHLALHTAYWHDDFGDVHSHGCVNLAPRDARLLFDWAVPALPAGWSTIYDDQQRGSVVRVHRH
jgi:lipoprotein-anchoring transpeptidase ErfK/SrfK